MGGKQMEGDNRERRKMAKEARDEGKKPSEIGATLGASKQRTEADENMSHQDRLNLRREGKQRSVRQNVPEARPDNKDPNTPDQEKYPRL